MTDTRHLDKAIEIFRSDKAKRAKPESTFTLQMFPDGGILQGPRGKIVKNFDPPNVREQAEAYVAAIPGATLTVYE